MVEGTKYIKFVVKLVDKIVNLLYTANVLCFNLPLNQWDQFLW